MFNKILHANDGSEPAFHALSLALTIALQNNSVAENSGRDRANQ